MLHCHDGRENARHAPSVDVIQNVPATLWKLPTSQAESDFLRKDLSVRCLSHFLHNGFPNIRDDTVEPCKVSHGEEIHDEGECQTTLMDDIDWRLHLHDAEEEEERREVD